MTINALYADTNNKGIFEIFLKFKDNFETFEVQRCF